MITTKKIIINKRCKLHSRHIRIASARRSINDIGKRLFGSKKINPLDHLILQAASSKRVLDQIQPDIFKKSTRNLILASIASYFAVSISLLGYNYIFLILTSTIIILLFERYRFIMAQIKKIGEDKEVIRQFTVASGALFKNKGSLNSYDEYFLKSELHSYLDSKKVSGDILIKMYLELKAALSKTSEEFNSTRAAFEDFIRMRYPKANDQAVNAALDALSEEEKLPQNERNPNRVESKVKEALVMFFDINNVEESIEDSDLSQIAMESSIEFEKLLSAYDDEGELSDSSHQDHDSNQDEIKKDGVYIETDEKNINNNLDTTITTKTKQESSDEKDLRELLEILLEK